MLILKKLKNKIVFMNLLNRVKPHLIVLLLFVGISFVYFSPLLEGKALDMQDIKPVERNE